MQCSVLSIKDGFLSFGEGRSGSVEEHTFCLFTPILELKKYIYISSENLSPGSHYCVLFFFFLEIHVLLFIYFWLCWVFVSVRGLSPVAASGGHSSSRCAGPPPPQPLPLRSTGSRRAGSATVAHGPSCSVACGIFPDQGSNPCPPHRQADSQPLRHQGSP